MHGFDAGKLIKGKQRHLLVDTLGLLLVALGLRPAEEVIGKIFIPECLAHTWACGVIVVCACA